MVGASWGGGAGDPPCPDAPNQLSPAGLEARANGALPPHSLARALRCAGFLPNR